MSPTFATNKTTHYNITMVNLHLDNQHLTVILLLKRFSVIDNSFSALPPSHYPLLINRWWYSIFLILKGRQGKSRVSIKQQYNLERKKKKLHRLHISENVNSLQFKVFKVHPKWLSVLSGMVSEKIAATEDDIIFYVIV